MQIFKLQKCFSPVLEGIRDIVASQEKQNILEGGLVMWQDIRFQGSVELIIQ